MSEHIRALTGGHRCPHGAMRATSQFRAYAGRVTVCECCRSPFGSNNSDSGYCPACREAG